MNLPNKLTLFRVILIPVFMLLFLSHSTVGLVFSLIVFCLAALTDFFDGQIARRSGCVTTFGKLMDPMADKLLVFSALICFAQTDVPYVNAWVVMIVLARELIVTGMRMLALEDGRVIAASMWGKLKTVSQFCLIIVAIINEIVMSGRDPLSGGFGNFLVMLLVIISLALTIVSGADYMYKNRGLITFK